MLLPLAPPVPLAADGCWAHRPMAASGVPGNSGDVEIDLAALSQLLTYEKPEHACRVALVRFNNNAEVALDFLLDTEEGARLCEEGDSSLAAPCATHNKLRAPGDEGCGTTTRGRAPLPALQAFVDNGDVEGVKGILLDAVASGGPRLEGCAAEKLRATALLHSTFLSKAADAVALQKKLCMMQVLVEADADVNSADATGRPCLSLAAESTAHLALADTERLALVRELLAARADANGADTEGATLLMEAAKSGDVGLCSLLLEARAEALQQSYQGSSAWDLALSHEKVAAPFIQSATAASVDRLVELLRGQDGDCGELLDVELHGLRKLMGSTATHKKLGTLLQDRNVDGYMLLQLSQTPSPAGMTAEAVAWLLAAEADPNVRNVLRETPLALAVRSCSNSCWSEGLRVVSLLLAAAADPNACDGQGETPLMEAVCMGDVAICTVLLDARADPTKQSASGMAPLSFGEEHPEVALLFRTWERCFDTEIRCAAKGVAQGDTKGKSFGEAKGSQCHDAAMCEEDHLQSNGFRAARPAPTDCSSGGGPALRSVHDVGSEDPRAQSRAATAGESVIQGQSATPSKEPQSPRSTAEALIVQLSERTLANDLDGVARVSQSLRAQGLDVARVCNSQDQDGNSLLHLGVKCIPERGKWSEAAEVIKVLTAHKADPSIKNFLGETPLLLAVRSTALRRTPHMYNGAACVVGALIDARANPDEGDTQGETALMEAACIGSMELCKLLLSSCASVNCASQSNLMAIDFAEDPDVIALFTAERRKSTQPQVATHAGFSGAFEVGSTSGRPATPMQRTDAAQSSPKYAIDEPAAKASQPCPEHSSKAAAGSGFQADNQLVQGFAGNRPQHSEQVMSDLLAKARKAPQVQVAAKPQPNSMVLFDMCVAGPLLDAVMAHQCAQVQRRLSALAEPMQQTRRGSPAIPGTTPLQDVLESRDADGHTLLHLCILNPPMAGHSAELASTASVLLGARACVNAANLQSETALLLAVREGPALSLEGRLALVGALLDFAADPNLGDANRCTPLHEAVGNCDAALIQLLVARSANAFLRGGAQNKTAFESMCATCPTLAATASMQLSKGLPSETRQGPPVVPAGSLAYAPSTREAYLIAMSSAVQGHSAALLWQVATAWEAAGWDLAGLLAHADADGNTWLHTCVLSPLTDLGWDAAIAVAKLLLDARMQPDMPNKSGETPLWVTVRELSSGGFTDTRLLDMLLAAGACPDHANGLGQRPLMEAAEVGDVEVCRILLAARADPFMKNSRGTSAIHLAAPRSEVAALLKSAMFLATEEPVQGKTVRPRTPTTPHPDIFAELCNAIMMHESTRVGELLGSIGDRTWLTKQDADGNAALHSCLLAPPSERGLVTKFETLQLLLAARADPNQMNQLGETPLLIAVREAAWTSSLDLPIHCKLVDALLNASADFEAADLHGTTPLMEACKQDDVDLFTRLVNAGASASRPSKEGRKVRDWAPRHGSIAQALATDGQLSGGFKAAQLNGAFGKTSRANGIGSVAMRASNLVQAVQAHNATLLNEILASYRTEGKNAEALLNVQDADGHGLLHLCLIAPLDPTDTRGLPDTVKTLLAAKAETNLMNCLGETPLLLTVREAAGTDIEARLTVLRMLMKAGAKYDLGDLQDTTPLMEAAMLGDAEICELFLDRGADMRRRGANGLSALELALQHPGVRRVFEAQAERGEACAVETAVPVEVTLRHALTQLERAISVPSNASICDIKKLIVRLTHKGSWRRIALLSPDGRMLHDSEQLRGRKVLIIADSKSIEARKAAEELLSEEERWLRFSCEQLQIEADRRGFFGGVERDRLISSLTEVKKWEALAPKDLRAECAKRSLAVDSNPDKDDLLAQLKQDFSWENMPEADLRGECIGRGIPLPEVAEQPAFDRAMRVRLRQALRWERLPVEQLRRACEARNLEVEGQTREEMLSFLKAFKVLPKAKPKAAKPAAPVLQPRTTTNGHEAYRVPGYSAFDRSTSPPEVPEAEDGAQMPEGLSERVWRICRKYPNFTGNYPKEINDWSDQDIQMYLYSNGFLKPNKSRKVATTSKVPLRVHFRTLGLLDGASPNEVRTAYRRLALMYHPDKNPSNPEVAAEKFRQVTEAYEALTAPVACEVAG